MFPGEKRISEANMSLPANQRSANAKIHSVEFLRRYWTALQCIVLSFETKIEIYTFNILQRSANIALPTDLPVMGWKPTGVF